MPIGRLSQKELSHLANSGMPTARSGRSRGARYPTARTRRFAIPQREARNQLAPPLVRFLAFPGAKARRGASRLSKTKTTVYFSWSSQEVRMRESHGWQKKVFLNI